MRHKLPSLKYIIKQNRLLFFYNITQRIYQILLKVQIILVAPIWWYSKFKLLGFLSQNVFRDSNYKPKKSYLSQFHYRHAWSYKLIHLITLKKRVKR